jgi:hypothetical protein
MPRFGPNLFGEILEPGRVSNVRLGIVTDQPVPAIPLVPGSILLVAPPGLLHPKVRQLDGGLLYDLVTGHPSRVPGDLVFLADLTQELWAWDGSTWASLGIDPARVCDMIALRHQHGDLDALRVGDLTADELRALDQLPMAARRDELRRRLHDRVAAPATPRPRQPGGHRA